MGFRTWLTGRIAAFMDEPVAIYQLRGHNDFDQLKRVIRTGDVLLVEGDQRVSAVIKYLTQSSWSHAALYIGDELVRRGGRLQAEAEESFGAEAQHVLVEALVDGVVASPVSKYQNFNVRLCRPHSLRSEDLQKILDDAVESIGWRYDLRNVIDLAIYLLRVSLRPRVHQEKALGSGTPSQVICTSLLGRLFHDVKFPVLPSVEFPDSDQANTTRRFWPFRRRHNDALFDAVFHRRHPTLLTPRDFDLSPYFDIVKFNIIEHGSFDYQRIAWADDPSAETSVESS
ncbi:MAG: YiiX/YebB-like N1pC/P60 family cysteine hydrolase [Myxococcota bacterium]